MRVGATDYWIHYQQARSGMLWNWAAEHFDVVIGGSVDEYKSRNPTLRQMVYNLVWAPRQSDVAGMESWLTGNGFLIEDAYLHATSVDRSKGSRVTATIWGSARYLTNPGDSGFVAWKRHQTREATATRPSGFRYDGLFIDELGTGVMGGKIPASTAEYLSREDYYDDFRTLLGEMRKETPANLLELNIAQYSRPEDLAQVKVAGGAMAEVTNSPYAEIEGVWNYLEAMVAEGSVAHFSTGVAAATKHQPRQDMNGGNYATVAERVLMWEYASYLMIVNPSRMDALTFNPFGNFSVDPSTVWLHAFETDLGLASSPRKVVRQGADGAGHASKVWAREFENALVVIRPKAKYDYDQYGDQTAVSVTLPPGTWRMLLPDGSVREPATAVALRNSEAAVFLKR
jgi:hypothetical protein